MDLLTHTLCGAAAGTVAASFSDSFKSRVLIIIAAASGGTFPDMDAVSLWSKFDKTLGAFFDLPYTGKEIYSAKLWYSHHAFMHSVFAGVLIAAIIWFAAFLVKNKFRNFNKAVLKQNFSKSRLFFSGFLSGWFLHLAGDLPTPSSTWGGIRMFFPFKTYIGGTGTIWCWNNYDIFLTVCAVILINILLLAAGGLLKDKVKYLTAAVFVAGFCFSVYRIETRGFDFSYSGNTSRYWEYEQKSKDIQRDLLGEKLYKVMEKIDKTIPIYF